MNRQTDVVFQAYTYSPPSAACAAEARCTLASASVILLARLRRLGGSLGTRRPQTLIIQRI